MAGSALRKLIDERGGIKGRIGDLLGDPVSQDSALSFPLISVAQFPGSPISTRTLRNSSSSCDTVPRRRRHRRLTRRGNDGPRWGSLAGRPTADSRRPDQGFDLRGR